MKPDSTTIPEAMGIYKHPPGFRLRRGRNWFFLGLTYASYYLCRYNLSPIAPALMRDLNLRDDQYGALHSGRDWVYGMGQMINGLFTDRIGGKRAMTIGALSTIVLNLAFGFMTWSTLSVNVLLPMLVIIRSADGFFQAFGAPGFIKINTAWFRKTERGGFAGIFGAMINLGAIGANQLAQVLAKGASIPLLLFAITIPALNWRYMFFIPPMVVFVVIILMNLMVKNQPEEAGYQIKHDDEPDHDPNAKIKLRDVLKKIASNQIVWIVAGAYFCTGFVRRAIESWFAVYLFKTWGADSSTRLFAVLAVGLPVTATLGSLCSGFISDKLFGGKRAPVAAVLYLGLSLFAGIAVWLPHTTYAGSAWVAITVVLCISTMCNSTHSLLGTAAAMDLGGRKMAGFSSGVIDSFQYFGAGLSGIGLGTVFSRFADTATTVAGQATTTAPAGSISNLNPVIWFGSMIPFGVAGTLLMGYLWLKHGKSGMAGT